MGEPLFVHPSASVGGPPEHRKFIRQFYEGYWVRYQEPFFEPVLEDDVIVHEFCTINAGTFRPTTIGAGSFLMARVHIAHDVVVGEECELGAGVVVCGEVVIGDRVQIGGKASIKPMLTVGDGARIGGGSVVVRDVPAGEVWAGNPAKPLMTGREAEQRGQVPGKAPVFTQSGAFSGTVDYDLEAEQRGQFRGTGDATGMHDHHFHVDEEEARNALAG